MKRINRTLLTEIIVGILIAVIIIGLTLGIYYGLTAYRDYLQRTSYMTQAWSYDDFYNIGYVAHAEKTSPTETQTADIYSAINQSGLFKGCGFYIYVISEHFDYATDCAPVIISGKDGYKEEDFAYESYHKKYKTERQRSFHMTELPFHFQLNLTPIAELTAGDTGKVRIDFLLFRPDVDPSQMNQEELADWIALYTAGSSRIDIPYYFDGDYIYWGYSAIKEAKNS